MKAERDRAIKAIVAEASRKHRLGGLSLADAMFSFIQLLDIIARILDERLPRD